MYHTLLFYKYVHLPDAEEWRVRLLEFCAAHDVMGRILLAEEGINGTASALPENAKRFMDFLKSDPRFADMEWKIEENPEHAFAKSHVRVKKEIVHFGVDDVDVWEMTGRYLEPEEWQRMMDEEDAVVIDMRNKVEWELGRFKNAVTLPVEHFREIPQHLDELEKYRGKKILAYCTGGIRCEKATAFLLQQGFENVFHLHGGIIRYGQETGGKDFEGKCYVFDNRIGTEINSVNPTVVGRCYVCETPSEKMINCANPVCNRHFIVCNSCGWKYDGCCSRECKEHELKRIYDGSGFYQKEGGD